MLRYHCRYLVLIRGNDNSADRIDRIISIGKICVAKISLAKQEPYQRATERGNTENYER